MNLKSVVKQLEDGPVTFKTKGNSMQPLIESGDTVTVVPTDSAKVGDIALARVKGRWYLHLVKAINKEKYQISNNKGHVNGWTKKIVGIVVSIEPPSKTEK